MAAILEREIKLRFEHASRCARRGIGAGAAPFRPRRLQEDFARLDRADEALRTRRCALRVRMESGKTLLTFKGPVQPAVMKLREELETLVGDGPLLLHILGGARLPRLVPLTELLAEEFVLEDVIVAVDETPVGTFVEIEGGERGITEMADALGRTPRLPARLVPRTSSSSTASSAACRSPTCSSTID